MNSPRPGELPGLVAAFWLPSDPGMFVWQDVAESGPRGPRARPRDRRSGARSAATLRAATLRAATRGRPSRLAALGRNFLPNYHRWIAGQPRTATEPRLPVRSLWICPEPRSRRDNFAQARGAAGPGCRLIWLPSNPGMFVWQDVAESEAAGPEPRPGGEGRDRDRSGAATATAPEPRRGRNRSVPRWAQNGTGGSTKVRP